MTREEKTGETDNQSLIVHTWKKFKKKEKKENHQHNNNKENKKKKIKRDPFDVR